MRREGQRTARFLWIPLLLLSAFVTNAQDYKIRAKVDLVEVPVTVKNSDGKLVTGLGKDDFVLLEDGQRQTIATFTIDPVPLSAVVILDTGLSPGSFAKIQKSITALAGAFSQFDEVAVYRYDKFVTKVLDFSQSNEHIEIAMQTIRDIEPDIINSRLDGEPVRSPFSIPGPVINGAAVVPPGQLGVIVMLPPKKSSVLHDAVFAAAADLAKRERNRRKIILLVSDGATRGNDQSLETTSQSLLEKSVQVYSVGLDLPFPHKKLSVLGEYAKKTGGDAYFVDSIQNIETSYSTATETARNQYVLGYNSNNEVLGPGPVFREIDIEVMGRDFKTLHRKGYYQYP